MFFRILAVKRGQRSAAHAAYYLQNQLTGSSSHRHPHDTSAGIARQIFGASA